MSLCRLFLFLFGLVSIEIPLLYMSTSGGSTLISHSVTGTAGRSTLVDITKRVMVTAESISYRYLDESESKSKNGVLSLSDGSMVVTQVCEYTLNGFAATITEDRKDQTRDYCSNIEDIFDDSSLSIQLAVAPASGHWGLCRINETIWSINNVSDTCYSAQFLGKGVDVYVIDTGTYAYKYMRERCLPQSIPHMLLAYCN